MFVIYNYWFDVFILNFKHAILIAYLAIISF